jgi:hypothetical protein
MKTTTTLTTEQAQEYVEQLNNRLGLGALPEVAIITASDGSWIIRWDEAEEHRQAMTERQWRTWLDKRFGPGLAERLATSEG